MTTLEVHEGQSINCGGGLITFEPNGHVKAVAEDGEAVTIIDQDIPRSGTVEVWCSEQFAYIASLEGPSVWFVHISTMRLECAVELARLDMTGTYDPGGLHWTEFRGLDNGDVLLCYELGIARLGTDGRLLWHRVHDDLTARVRAVDDGVVRVYGDSGRYGLDLATGDLLRD